MPIRLVPLVLHEAKGDTRRQWATAVRTCRRLIPGNVMATPARRPG